MFKSARALRKIRGKLYSAPDISPTFCVYPWMEFIAGPTEHIKICCIAEDAVLDEKGRAYTCAEDSLEGYWNGYGLRRIRKKMLAGEKLSACRHCYYQESIGRTSYRQSFNKQWFKSEYGRDIFDRVEKSRGNGYRVEAPPLYLDIRPGNLCNLKCRMCNPGNSSKIYKEQKEMLKSHSEFGPLVDSNYFIKDEKAFHNWHKNKSLWKSVYKWAEGAKQLYFTGGEPTLIKENWRLIDHLKSKGISKNIDLIFNINCTQSPDKLLEAFDAFSTVTVTFSIDGYKETQEYIRHPSKWRDIESHIIKILKHRKSRGSSNVQFYFSPVAQVYNILDLPRLLRWIDKLQEDYGKIGNSMIMLTGPDYLDISILPNTIKKRALLSIEEYESAYKGSDQFLLECLRSIKNVLKRDEGPDAGKKLKRFYKYTKLLDEKRGESFFKAFPKLSRLLDEDGRWKN